MRHKSLVWRIFRYNEDNQIECGLCKALYKHYGGSTGSLKRHLVTKHTREWAELNRYDPYPVGAATPNTSQASCSTSPDEPQSVKREPKIKLENIDTCMEDNSSRQKQVDHLILQMICNDVQPFSIVSDTGFRILLNFLDPTYNLPDPKALKRELLPRLYYQQRMELQRELDDAMFVAVSIEVWTAQDIQTYITVTAHFIDTAWTLHCNVLETLKIPTSYTTGNIMEAMQDTFNKWRIHAKISCVVIDNCPGVLQAVKELGIPYITCFAQTLAQVVTDAVANCEPVMKVIERIQSLVRLFNSNEKFSDKLEEVQHSNNKPRRKLKPDVESKWNTMYYMLERYNEEHDMVLTALCMMGQGSLTISSEDFETSQLVVRCLKPFIAATTELSSQRMVPASKAIPIINGLYRALSKPELQSLYFSNILEGQMHLKFDGWAIDNIHGHCTYLDPRFKKLGVQNNTAVANIEREFAREIEELNRYEGHPKSANVTEKRESDEFLWDDFDQVVKEHDATNAPMYEASSEIKQYNEEKHLDRKCDPCEWWRHNGLMLPNLNQKAHRYLSIPATSKPAEWLFTARGDLFMSRRSNLKPSVVNEVLFLNTSVQY